MLCLPGIEFILWWHVFCNANGHSGCGLRSAGSLQLRNSYGGRIFSDVIAGALALKGLTVESNIAPARVTCEFAVKP